MKDRNNIELRTGDIVRIENAYFKNDNGIYVITHTPGDPSWCGRDYSLMKVCKNGKISTAKYNLAFWPLKAYTNDRAKNAAANEHNQSATIEKISGIPTAGVIDYFRTEAANNAEEMNSYKWRFGEESEVYTKTATRYNFYNSVVDYITAGERQERPEEPTAEEMPTDTPETATESHTAPESPTELDAPQPDTTTDSTTTAETDPEELPDSYYIENKETGKIELHFEKEYYLNLDESQKKEIKSNFLFSRHSGAWISRRKFPNLFWPKKVAEDLGLANMGAEGERRSFAEQMEVKAAKAEYRAERMEYKAEAAEKRAESLQAPINRMHGDIAFFTQPNINTSAGRAFTRQRNKMWDQYDRGIEEFRKSDYYRERAEAARATANQTETKDTGFCQRRIDEAEKTIRAQKRNLAIYEEKLNRIESGGTVKTWNGNEITAEEVTRWIEDANDIINEAIGKIAYYDALIQAAGGIIDRNQIKPGDMVKIRHNWIVKVISIRGAKNFTFEFLESHMRYADGTQMQGKAAYAEIKEIVKIS